MSTLPDPLDPLVTSVVPSLSRSLAEQFNLFRVMRHGTHEKQLSNVFAWLLDSDGTHGLGDAVQRLVLTRVNAQLGPEAPFPLSGYRVRQEVDTADEATAGMDIADIVLTSDSASVVIENYGTSDGHGHSYHGYLAYGARGGRRSTVVLLCIRQDPSLQTDGWEQAIVLTYASILEDLRAHIQKSRVWKRDHPQQDTFIAQLVDHFADGPAVVSAADRVTFLETMCATGESDRYGHRPQDTAAQEFAEQVAQHAKRLFEEGRRTLAEVKSTLRRYADRRLRSQLDERLSSGTVQSVYVRFVGQWEWWVRLRADDGAPVVDLVFGPTAVAYNSAVKEPVASPDYRRIFLHLPETATRDVARLVQTEVDLADVLAGLGMEDARLADSIADALRSD